jgi:hypothetical protein
MGLLMLCTRVTPLPSLSAQELSPERLVVEAFCQAIPARCPQGAAQIAADDLWTLDGPLLQPAASAPPEEPLASDCRYVGFQTEWVASKRDAGLPLDAALAAARRVFALDLSWAYVMARALGTLVYRVPQRSPAELRQAMEAACRTHPRLWVDRHADW